MGNSGVERFGGYAQTNGRAGGGREVNMATWNARDIPDQTGRTAVVTGANSGLGWQIVAALAGAGAAVVLACRNPARAETAAVEVRRLVPGARLRVATLDLGDLASVASFVAAFRSAHSGLDLLVNNAGLMAVDQSVTADGFETQFGVNHLGHYALTAGLLPAMVTVPGSRVGTMSSLGHRAGRLVLDDLMWHRRGYARWGAYFQSKLANLLFTADLHHRLAAASAGTVAVAAHPGGARTDLGVEGTGASNALIRLAGPYITQPAADGALPMLRALTDPNVRGGQYYGPRYLGVGDPVPETPSRRARRAVDAEALAAESARLTGAILSI